MRKYNLDPERKIKIPVGEAGLVEFRFKQVMVPPDREINLKKDYNPDFTGGFDDKVGALAQVAANVERLAELQDKLYAQDIYALLIVFQARGMIGIFNRSYYEEVLVVRVHPEFLAKQKLPPSAADDKLWRRRFKEINNFEKYLVRNGIMVLKFFLNVSRGEQRKRFLARIDKPAKNWKFSVADYKERAHWDDYQNAYNDLLNHTSTQWVPWFVIPADNKWFARLAISQSICAVLESLELSYPQVSEQRRIELQEIKQALENET